MKKKGLLPFLIIFLAVFCSYHSARATTYAYIADSSTNSVSVIRTTDQAVIKTIPVGSAPRGIAVSPQGGNVYVTNEADGTVSVIRTSDHTVTDTVRVGNSPRGIAVDPDEVYVYVANYADNTVSVLTTYDDDENEVTATISVGSGPYGVEAGVDGAYIYVTNSLDHTLSIIRTDDYTVLDTLGVSPSGIAASPDGKYLYVSNSDSNTVSVIKAEDSDDDDDLVIKDHTLENTIAVGNQPTGITTVGEGAYVFVANSGDDTVSVIRTSDNTVIQTIAVCDNPYGVAAPMNGSFVVVLGTDDIVSIISASDYSVTAYQPVANASLIGFGHFIGGRPPSVPEDFSVDATYSNGVDLVWVDTSFDESGFKIKRKLSAEDSFTLIATVGANVTEYSDTGLASDTYYQYIIQAYNEAANSSFYSPIYVLTDEEGSDSDDTCFIGRVVFRIGDRHIWILSGLLIFGLAFFVLLVYDDPQSEHCSVSEADGDTDQ